MTKKLHNIHADKRLIGAVQWDGDNLNDLQTLTGNKFVVSPPSLGCSRIWVSRVVKGGNLKSIMSLELGCWLVKYRNGRLKVLTNDEFLAMSK